MLTQDQIETFIKLVEDETGTWISEENVTETADTIADFVAQHGAAQNEEEGLWIWKAVQARPGDRRKTLCVFDFGDARAAYVG